MDLYQEIYMEHNVLPILGVYRKIIYGYERRVNDKIPL